MNVPLHIVRKGKAEEYVKLSETSKELYRKRNEQQTICQEIMNLLFSETSHQKDRYHSAPYYISWWKDKKLTRALTIEDLSKQLTKEIGKLIDIEREETMIKDKLNEI